jgi:hypothetical protein
LECQYAGYTADARETITSFTADACDALKQATQSSVDQIQELGVSIQTAVDHAYNKVDVSWSPGGTKTTTHTPVHADTNVRHAEVKKSTAWCKSLRYV